MEITAECPCGARLTVEDASEMAGGSILATWGEAHQGHHRSLEEYQAYLRATHRPTEGLPERY